jgi:hypothetical protein
MITSTVATSRNWKGKKSWFNLHSCQPSNSETTRVAKGLLKEKSIGFIVIFRKTISISNLHNHKIPKIRSTSPFFTWYASCDWWRFWYLVVPLPPCVVAGLFWAIFLPGLWSLPFVSFSLPFLGCFLFMKFGRFHQSSLWIPILFQRRDGIKVIIREQKVLEREANRHVCEWTPMCHVHSRFVP